MTIRVVSYSELDTSRQCAFKHQLSYVERWSKPKDPMSALGKGTAWHNVMEAHYHALMVRQRDGVNHSAADLRRATRDAADAQLRRMTDDQAGLIEWMYSGYTELYGTDVGWSILAVEHNAECRLPALSGNPSTYALKVKIDLVIRNRSNGKIYVVDHKSGKDLPGEKSLDMDDQFGLYTWAMRQLGKNVFGQIHNAARTYRLQEDVKEPGATPLDKRFKRTPLSKTKLELDNIAREAYMEASNRYRQQREVDNAVAQGLKVVSPRSTNPDTCNWRCDFTEACRAGRKGLSTQRFLQDQGFEQNFERH